VTSTSEIELCSAGAESKVLNHGCFDILKVLAIEKRYTLCGIAGNLCRRQHGEPAKPQLRSACRPFTLNLRCN
jgi:hypothetical protein